MRVGACNTAACDYSIAQVEAMEHGWSTGTQAHTGNLAARAAHIDRLALAGLQYAQVHKALHSSHMY